MNENIDFKTDISTDNRFNICIIKLNDIKEIVKMLKNPNVFKYLYFAPSPEGFYYDYFISIYEEISNIINSNGDLKKLIFVIRDSKTNEYIGKCGILDIDMIENVYEIGYQISEKYWKKGIGTYICSLLKDFAFNNMNARRLYADCYGENIGSIKILEKNGFKQEGCLKKYYKDCSGYHDKIIFGLLKEDL